MRIDRVFAVLSEPIRLNTLLMLEDGDRYTALLDKLGYTKQNSGGFAHHLRELIRAGLVEKVRGGPYHQTYRLTKLGAFMKYVIDVLLHGNYTIGELAEKHSHAIATLMRLITKLEEDWYREAESLKLPPPPSAKATGAHRTGGEDHAATRGERLHTPRATGTSQGGDAVR